MANKLICLLYDIDECKIGLKVTLGDDELKILKNEQLYHLINLNVNLSIKRLIIITYHLCFNCSSKTSFFLQMCFFICISAVLQSGCVNIFWGKLCIQYLTWPSYTHLVLLKMVGYTSETDHNSLFIYLLNIENKIIKYKNYLWC